MSTDKFYIDPLLPLYAQRARASVTHQSLHITTAKDIHTALRHVRMKWLGSNVLLHRMVRQDGEPNEQTVKFLAEYLGEMTERFLVECKNDTRYEHFCYNFYYYATQIYATGHLTGYVDDYIELAKAYEVSSNIIHIIFTENLPPELAEEAGRWVMEHDAAPKFFEKCVKAAVAVLLGVMPEPDAIKENDNNG